MSLVRVRNSRQIAEDSGFTLIEVAMAVAVLGLALTIIVTMQSRYIASFLREENIFRAALYSQFIMTMLEMEGEAPDEGTTEGELTELLDQGDYFSTALTSEDKERAREMRYQRVVSTVPLQNEASNLRAVELTISWGESSLNSYRLIYFMRASDEETP